MFIITQADKAQKETDDITTIIMMYVKLRTVTMGFPSESRQENENRLITYTVLMKVITLQHSHAPVLHNIILSAGFGLHSPFFLHIDRNMKSLHLISIIDPSRVELYANSTSPPIISSPQSAANLK